MLVVGRLVAIPPGSSTKATDSNGDNQLTVEEEHVGLGLAWDCALLKVDMMVRGFDFLAPSWARIAQATVFTLVIWMWLRFLLGRGFI